MRYVLVDVGLACIFAASKHHGTLRGTRKSKGNGVGYGNGSWSAMGNTLMIPLKEEMVRCANSSA